ncbi:MAG: DUF933 domain-containing protein, partial [Patescibacteria group bacterium]
EIVNTELILADLQTMENSKTKNLNLEKKLNAGELAGEEGKEWQLLTAKPVIYVMNINSVTRVGDLGGLGDVVYIDAKLEADLAVLTAAEQKEYLASLGIKDSGVNQLINKCYEKLGLISFLTAGVKEVRAWTIRSGLKAPQAAGVIHTDFEKNFIKAEIVGFEDFVECGGWKKARELGKVRLEGKEYVINDGDVIEFKIGV